MSDQPLISCLMVSKNEDEYIRRAVWCYQHQTYPNCELVIVIDGKSKISPDMLLDLLDGARGLSTKHNVKVIACHEETLGELRNVSVSAASGEIVCQWDDDDWYASDRIQLQYEALIASGKAATCMSNWIIYDSVERKAYRSFYYSWEGSLMGIRHVVNYPALSRGEDSALVRILLKNKALAVQCGIEDTYIYVVHGHNTWDAPHFDKIKSKSTLLNNEETRAVEARLNSTLRE